MTVNKRLSIILPSYNDARIGRAIESIRKFDDISTTRIIVVDGGSSNEIKTIIREKLTDDDVFISEPDKGIFDALNKGLSVCDTEFIGWLGSDDVFTGKVPASQVVEALDKSDIFIGGLYFVHKGYVTRKTHALPSRLGLMKLGLHNPHYATFGKGDLLKSERFELDLRGSDIEYFIRIFEKKPHVTMTRTVVTLQEEGGFSNNSVRNILHTNWELVPVYARYSNWLIGVVAAIVKLGYKLLSKMYFAVFKVQVHHHLSKTIY